MEQTTTLSTFTKIILSLTNSKILTTQILWKKFPGRLWCSGCMGLYSNWNIELLFLAGQFFFFLNKDDFDKFRKSLWTCYFRSVKCTASVKSLLFGLTGIAYYVIIWRPSYVHRHHTCRRPLQGILTEEEGSVQLTSLHQPVKYTCVALIKRFLTF